MSEFKRLHYELWNWLSEDPLREIDCWPEWEEVNKKYGRITNCCFACAVFCKCSRCPLSKEMGGIHKCNLFYLFEGLKRILYVKLHQNFDEDDQSTILITKDYIDNLKTEVKLLALQIRDCWK